MSPSILVASTAVMPADYQSMARALSLPVSPPHTPVDPRRSSRPPWSLHSRSDSATSRSRFLVAGSLKRQWMANAELAHSRARKLLVKLPLWQRVVGVILLLLGAVAGALVLIFNERIFTWIEPFADRWRALPAGWLIVWFMIFITAFPPMVGFSISSTLAGFLYGLPQGWFLCASATVVGSLCSFMLSRTILSSYANRLVEKDKRFAALALTLKHDGLKVLVMIRFCPLPYSLSNCAMAAFPINPLVYALATAIATPKLFIHIFVGGRLGDLAERGGKMDAGTKAINYASIASSLIVGVAVGWWIYHRTMARARQLDAEERATGRESAGPYDDIVDFEDDLEDNRPLRDGFLEDDISLFENRLDDEVYQDEPDPGRTDVFSAGDRDASEEADARGRASK